MSGWNMVALGNFQLASRQFHVVCLLSVGIGSQCKLIFWRNMGQITVYVCNTDRASKGLFHLRFNFKYWLCLRYYSANDQGNKSQAKRCALNEL